MYLEDGQVNYVIIYSKNKSKIEKYLKNKMDYYHNLSKQKNVIYFSQNYEALNFIDMDEEINNIKELSNEDILLINRVESDRTGDVEVEYYFGDEPKNHYYESFDSYYPDGYDYDDENEKGQNVNNEIQKLVNDFESGLSPKEIAVLNFYGFKTNDTEQEYSKKDMFLLDIEEGATEIKRENIRNGKPGKVFVFPENIEYLRNPLDEKIEKIVFNNKIKEICEFAFMGLRKLKYIEMPSSVEKIGTDAFLSDSNLMAVDLSKTKISILYGIFTDCKSLKKVYLPKTITQIDDSGHNIFEDCPNVVVYSESNAVIKYAKKNNIKINIEDN